VIKKLRIEQTNYEEGKNSFLRQLKRVGGFIDCHKTNRLPCGSLLVSEPFVKNKS